MHPEKKSKGNCFQLIKIVPVICKKKTFGEDHMIFNQARKKKFIK